MDTDRIWYIKWNDNEEGPFTFEELKNDVRLTPDTLARREGQNKWIPLRKIAELDLLFKDEDSEEVDEEAGHDEIVPQDELTLQLPLSREPSYFFLFWLVIVAIIISYVLYQLYWNL